MKNTSTRKNQSYWLAHVIASGQAQSMIAYANVQGIDAQQLYAWKSKLAKSGQLTKNGVNIVNTSLFEKVDITKTYPLDILCKITLPNHISIDFPMTENLDALTVLVRQLGKPL